ncbi:MAG: transcription elongation factor GreA [Candidatus Niyogibacteria bacterium]|nr:transcription elongation factor GreA [Candidatus Niyogibacteria bacterium]
MDNDIQPDKELLPSENQDDGDLEYLSEEGFRKLKEDLEVLRTKKRKEIAKRLEYAKSLGDLSENAEYTEAKIMQEDNEARIAEFEDTLSRMVLITKPSTLAVAVGSTVKVERHGSGIEEYILVGSEEANPLLRKISNESPLGRAFLGRKKGEKVDVMTPRGLLAYTIVDIV